MVLPVHDVNPVHRTPWITYSLLASNILIFLATPASMLTGVGDVSLGELCEHEAFYVRYGAIPREMIGNEPLQAVPTGAVGAGDQGAGCVVSDPPYEKIPALSVLYSMFLHGSWLHLLGNMLFLWVFGNNVEDRLGRLGYLIFYLLCGYVAAYGFALADPTLTTPLIGASGAVSGVLGAYLVLFPMARVWSLVPVLLFIPLRLPAWLVLGMWFVLQWIYSVGYAIGEAGNVAYLAHVLGFGVGVLIALPVRWSQPRRRRRQGQAEPPLYYRREWH